MVVIGDVGGHPDELDRALAPFRAGAGRLADDVTVVQVGDLVDRGPDSHGVLEIVRRHLDEQPDRWVQLIGNHEQQYIVDGFSFYPQPFRRDDAELLRAWWADGRIGVAAAVRDPARGDLLLTHGGLTVRAWRALGSPPSAAEAAAALNRRPPLIWQAGDMLASGTFAGPLWADAGWELYAPWLEHRDVVPFGQVHGHSQAVRFGDGAWLGPGRVRGRATIDQDARRVTVRIGGREFIGVDPKHGRSGGRRWQPLVLENAVLL